MSPRLLISAGAFITSFFALAAFAHPHQQIVGGQEARPGEFPSIVSIRNSDGDHSCGGTLVAANWVLTAAHCVHGQPMKVVTGFTSARTTEGDETFTVVASIIHPQNNQGVKSSHDFALLKLSGSSKSTPALLNSAALTVSDDESQAPLATIAGWGAVSEMRGQFGSYPDRLYRADVALVSERRCAAVFQSRIDTSMMCAGFDAGGRDTCAGDSGGPLLFRTSDGRETLIGVTSWGDGCARAHSYGLYGRVDVVAEWIKQTIRSN